LVVLAFFALFGGFVGVPEDFPVLGPLFGGNPFHHFVGEVVEAVGVHLEVHELSAAPLLISILAALGGLFLGWLVYGRRPLRAGEVDPLKRWLGPVHTVLENKYYVDELYQAVFIRPTVALAQKVYAWIDRGIIDGILHTVARGVFQICLGNRWFDRHVVDGTVNLVGNTVKASGRALRPMQTGQVQNYILIAIINVLIFVVLYLYFFAGG